MANQLLGWRGISNGVAVLQEYTDADYGKLANVIFSNIASRVTTTNAYTGRLEKRYIQPFAHVGLSGLFSHYVSNIGYHEDTVVDMQDGSVFPIQNVALYQVQIEDPTKNRSITLSPAGITSGTNIGPLDMTSGSLSNLGNILWSHVLNNDGPGSYRASNVNPGGSYGGTWEPRIKLTDYYADNFDGEDYWIYQRVDDGDSYASLNRPVKLEGMEFYQVGSTFTGTIKLFSDAEIISLESHIQNALVTYGLGTYVYQETAPGTGTWVNCGTVLNRVYPYRMDYLSIIEGYGGIGNYDGLVYTSEAQTDYISNLAYSGFTPSYGIFTAGVAYTAASVFGVQNFLSTFDSPFAGEYNPSFGNAFAGFYNLSYATSYLLDKEYANLTNTFSPQFTSPTYSKEYTATFDSAAYTTGTEANYLGPTESQNYVSTYTGPSVAYTGTFADYTNYLQANFNNADFSGTSYLSAQYGSVSYLGATPFSAPEYSGAPSFSQTMYVGSFSTTYGGDVYIPTYIQESYGTEYVGAPLYTPSYISAISFSRDYVQELYTGDYGGDLEVFSGYLTVVNYTISALYATTYTPGDSGLYGDPAKINYLGPTNTYVGDGVEYAGFIAGAYQGDFATDYILDASFTGTYVGTNTTYVTYLGNSFLGSYAGTLAYNTTYNNPSYSSLDYTNFLDFAGYTAFGAILTSYTNEYVTSTVYIGETDYTSTFSDAASFIGETFVNDAGVIGYGSDYQGAGYGIEYTSGYISSYDTSYILNAEYTLTAAYTGTTYGILGYVGVTATNYSGLSATYSGDIGTTFTGSYETAYGFEFTSLDYQGMPTYVGYAAYTGTTLYTNVYQQVFGATGGASYGANGLDYATGADYLLVGYLTDFTGALDYVGVGGYLSGTGFVKYGSGGGGYSTYIDDSADVYIGVLEFIGYVSGNETFGSYSSDLGGTIYASSIYQSSYTLTNLDQYSIDTAAYTGIVNDSGYIIPQYVGGVVVTQFSSLLNYLGASGAAGQYSSSYFGGETNVGDYTSSYLGLNYAGDGEINFDSVYAGLADFGTASNFDADVPFAAIYTTAYAGGAAGIGYISPNETVFISAPVETDFNALANLSYASAYNTYVTTDGLFTGTFLASYTNELVVQAFTPTNSYVGAASTTYTSASATYIGDLAVPDPQAGGFIGVSSYTGDVSYLNSTTGVSFVGISNFIGDTNNPYPYVPSTTFFADGTAIYSVDYYVGTLLSYDTLYLTDELFASGYSTLNFEGQPYSGPTGAYTVTYTGDTFGTFLSVSYTGEYAATVANFTDISGISALSEYTGPTIVDYGKGYTGPNEYLSAPIYAGTSYSTYISSYEAGTEFIGQFIGTAYGQNTFGAYVGTNVDYTPVYVGPQTFGVIEYINDGPFVGTYDSLTDTYTNVGINYVGPSSNYAVEYVGSPVAFTGPMTGFSASGEFMSTINSFISVSFRGAFTEPINYHLSDTSITYIDQGVDYTTNVAYDKSFTGTGGFIGFADFSTVPYIGSVNTDYAGAGVFTAIGYGGYSGVGQFDGTVFHVEGSGWYTASYSADYIGEDALGYTVYTSSEAVFYSGTTPEYTGASAYSSLFDYANSFTGTVTYTDPVIITQKTLWRRVA